MQNINERLGLITYFRKSASCSDKRFPFLFILQYDVFIPSISSTMCLHEVPDELTHPALLFGPFGEEMELTRLDETASQD